MDEDLRTALSTDEYFGNCLRIDENVITALCVDEKRPSGRILLRDGHVRQLAPCSWLPSSLYTNTYRVVSYAKMAGNDLCQFPPFSGRSHSSGEGDHCFTSRKGARTIWLDKGICCKWFL
jgi:hypothetical protein